MKKFLQLLKMFYVVCIISFYCEQTYAVERCYTDMSEVLGCFLSYDDGAYKHEFVEENNDNHDVTIKTYLLYSQKWPIDGYQDIPSTVWKHKLVFYIPKIPPVNTI